MKTLTSTALAVSFLAAGVLAGCGELPPITSTQTGHKGTGMVQFDNPETVEKLAAANIPPAPPYDRAEDDGTSPRAGDFYENVVVLRDISTDDFNRLMLAMTEWVVPESYRNQPDSAGGCNYCHNPANMASDEIYTKVVARKMFQMTQTINVDYKSHVAATGVTCYTCHRGQFIPANYWSEQPPDPRANLPLGSKRGESVVGFAGNGYTSMTADPFSKYLNAPGDAASYLQTSANIRVFSPQSAPGANEDRIEDAERTYALMMHLSQSLGVNCTFCHNTGNFQGWTTSTPQRVTAYHGLGMVGQVNHAYITPLQPVFPANRLGPMGDPFKVNCTTCHIGANKPLNGAQMAKDYPELLRRTNLVAQAATPAAPADTTAAAAGAAAPADAPAGMATQATGTMQ